ncbi:MAG TPA: trehalose-6-phosphate synthase, partial [Thermoanaerobaculia bacterium]
LDCAERILGAQVDREACTATHDGHTCRVRAIPISIDVESFVEAAHAPGVDEQIETLRRRYAPPGGVLGVGVDRMDYSKGLPEKIKALDYAFERYPELHGRFSFVQVAVPSRTAIEAYDELTGKVERMVWEVNDRFGTDTWRPVHLIKQALPPERLAVLYRASDVCIVGSLADGMNLVAKEYVASRDGDGVLLLSRFAGAADELDGHVEANPYDPEEYARLIREAVAMPEGEQRERMARLRGTIGSVYVWMERFFRYWVEARHESGTTAAGAAAR